MDESREKEEASRAPRPGSRTGATRRSLVLCGVLVICMAVAMLVLVMRGRLRQNALYGAVVSQDLAKVDRLSDDKRLLNGRACWRNFDTPLHAAAERGYADIVKILIAKGADMSIPADAGDTPLLRAARESRWEVGEILLANGASPNVATEYGTTALHMASEEGNEHMVKALLGHGADVAAITTAYGSGKHHRPALTARMIAQSCGYGEVTALLLAAEKEAAKGAVPGSRSQDVSATPDPEGVEE